MPELTEDDAIECYDHIEVCEEAFGLLIKALEGLKATKEEVNLTVKAAGRYPWYSLACDAVYAARKDFGKNFLGMTVKTVPEWYLARNVGRLALDVLILGFKLGACRADLSTTHELARNPNDEPLTEAESWQLQNRALFL